VLRAVLPPSLPPLLLRSEVLRPGLLRKGLLCGSGLLRPLWLR